MNDFLDDNRVAPFLSGAELMDVALPQVRKGGVDEMVVRTLLERAATTIDAIGAHAARLEKENVLLAQKAEAASEDASRSAALLSVAPAAAETESGTASVMLAAAERVAAEVRAAAETEAETVRSQARADAEAALAEAEAAAAAIVSDAQARAEEVHARGLALEQQLAASRGRVDEEMAEMVADRERQRAELEQQLAQYRSVASGVHLRAVGSLEAALATLNSYVASVAETADEVVGISDAWEDELSFDDGTGEGRDTPGRRSVVAEDAGGQVVGNVAEDTAVAEDLEMDDEVVYVVEVTSAPVDFGDEMVVHETDEGVWVRSSGPIEDDEVVALALAATHPLVESAEADAVLLDESDEVVDDGGEDEQVVAGIEAVPPAPPTWANLAAPATAPDSPPPVVPWRTSDPWP